MVKNIEGVIYPRAENDPMAAGMLTDPKELEILDRRIELAILFHCEKINEGNNGVIFRLRIDEDDDSLALAEVIGERRTSGQEKENVIKILKVYQQGKGRKEFEMQRIAYNLMREHGTDECGRVPEPILFRELSLKQQETKDFLKSKGIDAQNKIEIIIMDFVPGIDLATFLYREVMRRQPWMEGRLEEIEEMKFDDLKEEVTRALGLAKPGGKGSTEVEREAERRQVENMNAATITKFLVDRGFGIDPRIREKLERTMALFHAHGFAFRDGHQRNFMLTGQNEDLNVFIVDYGNSTTYDVNSTTDVYVEGEKTFPRDEDILNYLRMLTKKTPEGFKKEDIQKINAEVKSLRKRLRAGAVWEKTAEELNRVGLDIKKIFSLLEESKLIGGSDDLQKIYALLVVLTDFISSGKYSSEEVRAILKEYIEHQKLEDGGETLKTRDLQKFLKTL